jgi:hypothetical protein
MPPDRLAAYSAGAEAPRASPMRIRCVAYSSLSLRCRARIELSRPGLFCAQERDQESRVGLWHHLDWFGCLDRKDMRRT